MATIYQSHSTYIERSSNHARTGSKVSQIAVPIGRFLFSLIFVISGINHFTSGSVAYAAAAGVPFADVLVPISGVLALVGGASVMLGIHARMGALLLLLFLIPVTVMMHPFWTVSDPGEAQVQLVNFLKNLSLIGGALFVTFYGAGPFSWDHHTQVRTVREVG